MALMSLAALLAQIFPIAQRVLVAYGCSGLYGSNGIGDVSLQNPRASHCSMAPMIRMTPYEANSAYAANCFNDFCGSIVFCGLGRFNGVNSANGYNGFYSSKGYM